MVYSSNYLEIINKLKAKVPGIKFTTDIIVGFCGETDEEFQDTVKTIKAVGYDKAFISMYSEKSPMTAATKVFTDDVPHTIKKNRWEVWMN